MTTITTSTGQYQIRDVYYTVNSATVHGRTYRVHVNPSDGVMDCECPARGLCWHQKAIIAGMAGKIHITARIMPTAVHAPPAPAKRPWEDLYA